MLALVTTFAIAHLPVRATLAIDVGAAAAPTEQTTRNDASGFSVEELGPDYDAVLRVSTTETGGARLDLETRWLRPVTVRTLAVTLHLPGAVSAVGRDLAYGPATPGERVDRGTPIFADGGDVVVAGGPGFAAARYDGADVVLIADDEAAHPFTAYEQCRKTYLPPAQPGQPRSMLPPPSLEKRDAHDLIGHQPGDVTRASATLAVVGAKDGFAPIVIDRWPAGARAAVAFTDHADRTDPLALRAILYGTSDEKSAAYGKGGFFGHGIAITKTFFVRPGRGSLDDDPDARALADELVAAGSEVGLHSITPVRDTRQAIADALPHARAWKPVTWIDHQPETNCEAISNRGWSDDPDFGGLAANLLAAQYEWIWNAKDIDTKGSVVANLFVTDKPALAAPPIFPFPLEPRLWMFASSWFYADAGRLGDAISDAALDGLEAQGGLWVAHTYLSASTRTTLTRALKARDAVVENNGVMAIDPRLDAALGRLGARVAAGRIASMTWRAVGDRLRALGDVTIEYGTDGVEIANRGDVDLSSLTVEIGGKPQTFDLPSGAVHPLKAAGRARPTTIEVTP